MALAPVLLPIKLTVAAYGAGKMYRVGHLSTSGKAASQPFIDAFREGMRALGYMEGLNWVLDERYAEGKRKAYHR
jgi:putative ABC transport system substrate-binding protein